MKVFKFFIALGLFLGCVSSLPANKVSNENMNQSGLPSAGNYREFVVSVDRLILAQEGLFVDLGCEGILPVESISFVEPGMYSVRFWGREECKRHGAYCPGCLGCHPYNDCVNRCKCPPRW